MAVGHGAPAILSCLWLEDSLSTFLPEYPRNYVGLKKLISRFSVPGGFPRYALILYAFKSKTHDYILATLMQKLQALSMKVENLDTHSVCRLVLSWITRTLSLLVLLATVKRRLGQLPLHGMRTSTSTQLSLVLSYLFSTSTASKSLKGLSLVSWTTKKLLVYSRTCFRYFSLLSVT